MVSPIVEGARVTNEALSHLVDLATVRNEIVSSFILSSLTRLLGWRNSAACPARDLLLTVSPCN